jgi:hypothetical protein
MTSTTALHLFLESALDRATPDILLLRRDTRFVSDDVTCRLVGGKMPAHPSPVNSAMIRESTSHLTSGSLP